MHVLVVFGNGGGLLFVSFYTILKCCNLHDLIYIFLDNGVMTTPKRRILSFLFTVLNLNVVSIKKCTVPVTSL